MRTVYAMGVYLEVRYEYQPDGEYFEIIEIWYEGERQKGMEVSEVCLDAVDRALKDAYEAEADDRRRYNDE